MSLETDDYHLAEHITSFYYFDEESLNNMVKSIVREFQWLPKEIGSLFIDGQDMYGIEYWHEDIENRMPKEKT